MLNEFGFEIGDCPECEVCGDVMSERITTCCQCGRYICGRHLKDGMCDICRHKEELKLKRKAELHARIMSGETMYGNRKANQ